MDGGHSPNDVHQGSPIKIHLVDNRGSPLSSAKLIIKKGAGVAGPVLAGIPRRWAEHEHGTSAFDAS